jgi:hypothetical protein
MPAWVKAIVDEWPPGCQSDHGWDISARKEEREVLG